MGEDTVLSRMLEIMANKSDEEHQAVEDAVAFTAISPVGYRVSLTDQATAYHHTFCGEQRLPGAMCPNCHKPLLQLLSLDTADPRLNLPNAPIRSIPLLYCWTCCITSEYFYYRLLPPGNAVEVISYGKGVLDEVEYPYTPYPDFFPGSGVELIKMSDAEQWFHKKLNAFWREHPELDDESYEQYQQFAQQHHDLDVAYHQVGGEPQFVQQWDTWAIQCPICHGAMPFLASILDDNLDPRGFTDTGETQTVFTYCKKCHVVGVAAQR